jgi:DNA-binding transcriptional ArsR family regulator
MAESMSPQLVSRVAERFKSLADENRLRLLMRLRQGPCHVNALAEALALGQASVSKHLAVLRQAGLVTAERQGTQMIYAVDDESIFDLCDLVCDGVVRHLEQQHAEAGLSRPTRRQGAPRRSPSAPRRRQPQQTKMSRP